MIRWFVLVIVLSYSTCCLTFLVWSGKSWEWCLLFDWRHPRNAIVIKQFSVFTSSAKLRRLKSMYFFLFLFLLFPFMILLKSSDFNGFDQIFSGFSSNLHKIDAFLSTDFMIIFFSGIFSGSRFFQIFPDFHQIIEFILFLSLLCSRSRTLRI